MSKSTTGGQTRFAQIPRADIPRSSLDRSCGLKTTFSSGVLVPIFADEALPGDTLTLKMATVTRMATPLHPFFDNLFMDTHWFAVPIRLLWSNWERFNGQQDDPDDSTDFLAPTLLSPNTGGWPEESIADYLGIPTKVEGLRHSSLWHRAYNLIWNEWFRDENLQDSVAVHTDDATEPNSTYELLRRGKRHDYFSSALPWPQKGPSVQLPLGGTAPVILDGGEYSNDWALDGAGKPTFDTAGTTPVINTKIKVGIDEVVSTDAAIDGFGQGDLLWNNPKIQLNVDGATGVADLSTATAATINEIRQAFQIQKLFERDARGGSRYTEILRAHFGVISPDQRLMRPEYLGGGTTRINMNIVPQTSETNDTPQGNLSGYAVAASNKHGFSKSFVEHCVILGLVSVRADLNYQQGLPRMFSRSTRFDYYWPAFSHLGEQSILNKEIYAQGLADIDADDEVFGYQERHAEYRYKPSAITGQMRSNATTPLDTWHLAQDFSNLPVLDSDFIEENPPVSRVIAVPSEPEFIMDSFFTYRCARPMPTYGVPGLIDHF